MRAFLLTFVYLLCGIAIGWFVFSPKPEAPEKSIAKLQEISMMVSSGGCGSTIFITRKRHNEYIHFAWTAAHVVANTEKVRQVLAPDGSIKYDIYYEDVELVNAIKMYGREVGEVRWLAQVIRYSNREHGQDIALLQLYPKNLTTKSAHFNTKTDIPQPGEPIFHVGSIRGLSGINSVSNGYIAALGRLRERQRILDQADIIACPGCSGGGLYLKSNSQCIGIVIEKNRSDDGVVYYRPTRELRKWAIKNKCLWALDHRVRLPNDDTIRRTPVSEHGITVEQKKEFSILDFFK